LNGVSSNIILQRSIAKSGITNFIFIIYYFHKDPLVILTDVETLRVFLLKICTILKKKVTKIRYRKNDKTPYIRIAISKPGELNPMFNNKHSSETKKQNIYFFK
jgi:hypothetical protein